MSYDPNQPQQPDPSQQPQPPYGQPQPPYEQQQWGQQPQPPYGQPGQPQQPPYGQPQQPYEQQQWAQQPPAQYAPTQYVAPAYGAPPVPGYAPPQQPGRSRRTLWIVLGIFGGLIVLSCAICGILFVAGVGFFAKTVAAPALVVNQYYSAVQKQDYNTAYSYIDQNLTASNNEPLTQQVYTVAAQLLDTTKGKVSNFSVGGNISVNNNTASVTVSVTRGGTAYDVHLQLQQVNGSWKITSYDNI